MESLEYDKIKKLYEKEAELPLVKQDLLRAEVNVKPNYKERTVTLSIGENGLVLSPRQARDLARALLATANKLPKPAGAKRNAKNQR